MAPTPDCVASGLTYAGSSTHVYTPTHPITTTNPSSCGLSRQSPIRARTHQGGEARTGGLDEPKRLNRDALICVCVCAVTIQIYSELCKL